VSRTRARLAVIGLGRIGRLHASNLAGRVASAELAAVVDPVEPLARSLGGRYRVGWATSAEEVLDGDVDGVVIAAPTALHVGLVRLAAGAGRHVFCEKPLGFDVNEAAAATACARGAGVVLQVGFQRRFDPGWLAVKSMLDGDELGTLELLRGSHRNAGEPHATEPLGDLFADVAIHDFDAARWLGGEVAELSAQARDGAATLALRFESGALGLIDVSRRAGYGFECSAEVVGSRATARVASGSHEVELLRDGQASSPLPGDHAQRHAAAYLAELDRFGAAVLGRCPAGPGGEEAIAALELAERARRSVAG
jgi:predicted dehydrogenase